MENEISIIFTQAQQEISENGVLSFPTRRKLWLTFGPWEVRWEDDPNPRTLTEPLKKRAELALACAKKVSRIWSAYDSEDKRPQKLIKETRAYLDGKRTARQLAEAGKAMEDFMTIIDEEADSTAPSAGMAAWNALVTALHDEPLLEERYADAEDSDLDSYDWDAAREASEAWAGAGRAEALIKQMEERAILRFEVTEHGVALNDRALDYLSRRLLEANLIPGLEWTDRDEDGFAVDLSVFGPHVVFQDLTYGEFVKKYPERVRQAGEHMTEIDFGRVWVRCYLDEGGALARVETTTRFWVRLENPERDKQKLVMALKALGKPEAEAKELVDAWADKAGDWGEMNCLSGFSRAEANRVLEVLRKCGVEGWIMPRLIAQGRDSW